jgi:hypothetical protein
VGSSDVTGSYITGNDVIGSCITGNDVTGTGSREPETGNEREIISRVLPVFPAFFPVFLATPLDSRYEQWNCESNLYRVTIALLPPMLNHFSLLNCAVSRD